MRIRRRGVDGVRIVCSVYHVFCYMCLIMFSMSYERWRFLFSHCGQRGIYTYMLHRSYPMNMH